MKNVGCNMFETRPTKRMLLQRDRIYNGKIQRIMRAIAISQHKAHTAQQQYQQQQQPGE